MELSEKKLKTRDYVVIASLLFGLFFGAGNLIFPFLNCQIKCNTF